MKAHFPDETFGSQEKQTLLTLIHTLVGQKTVVSSSLERIVLSDQVHADKILEFRLEKISFQICLKQSFECQAED